MDWENYRSKHTNIEGARAAFERDCTTLFRAINPETIVRNIDASQGDFGIDINFGIGYDKMNRTPDHDLGISFVKNRLTLPLNGRISMNREEASNVLSRIMNQGCMNDLHVRYSVVCL